MPPDLRQRLRYHARAAVLSAFLGLALGYAIFYTVFPTVSFPAAGEPPIWALLGLLLVVALCTGLVTKDPASAMLQAFLALPAGVAIASTMALSPVFGGLAVVRPEDILFFVFRFGLPLLLLALPVNIFGILTGMWAWERFGQRPASPVLLGAGTNRRG